MSVENEHVSRDSSSRYGAVTITHPACPARKIMMTAPPAATDDGMPGFGSAGASRPRAVAEAMAVLGLTMATLWIVNSIHAWSRWERMVLGGPWLVQILAFMIVPLVVVTLRGAQPGSLGVTFRGLRRYMETALTALAVVGPISGMAFPLLGLLGWSPMSWLGGLVLAAAYAISVPFVGLLVRKIPSTTESTLPAAHVVIAALVLVAAMAASAATKESAPIVSAVLLALLVVGPGEELLFRGVIQTRLDQAFGRPWRVFGADLGWGWVIASCLFGLAHLLSPAAFGHGGWALWTTVAGLLFGYLRAKSGSIVASTVVHGVLLAVSAFFT